MRNDGWPKRARRGSETARASETTRASTAVRVSKTVRDGSRCGALRRMAAFCADGFCGMGPLGRTLWTVVLVKLFVMFAVLKLFFFPDFLAGKDDAQRAAHVLEELTGQTTESG